MTAFRELVSEITEEDVAWVTELMQLKNLDAPRIEFLQSRETLDVSACPGSGKTTMVVAKLAILARKWTSRTRGSSRPRTNVSRARAASGPDWSTITIWASDGACAFIPISTDPDGECIDLGAASCGANGTGCDGSDACAF